MIALQAQVLLAVLAILALGADARRVRDAVPWLLGIVVGLLLCGPWPGRGGQALLGVEPQQLGLLLGLLALARVAGRLRPWQSLLAAGFCAGPLLQGLLLLAWPLPLAAVFLAGILTAAFACSVWHVAYRHAGIQEEACLALLAGGLLLAVVPGLPEGWQTALGLQQQDTSGMAASFREPWVFWITALCLVLGGLRCRWKYARYKRWD